MKLFFGIALALFTLASVACGGNDNQQPTPTAKPTPKVVAEATPAPKQATACDTLENKSPDMDYDGDAKSCSAIIYSFSLRTSFKLSTGEDVSVQIDFATFRAPRGFDWTGDQIFTNVRDQLSLVSSDRTKLRGLLEDAVVQFGTDPLMFGKPQLFVF